MAVPSPRSLVALRGPTVQSEYENTGEWLRQISEYLQTMHLESAVPLPKYTVATLPPASEFEGAVVYASDETGGAVPVFSDGTNWRRSTDRVIAS
jgi:hypothetical protein